MIGFFLALSIAAQNPPLPPEIVTGADVVRICSGFSVYEKTYCHGYIAGVNDSALDILDANPDLSFRFCTPQNATLQQVAEEVSQKISSDRRLWSTSSASATIVALTELYPCDQKGG